MDGADAPHIFAMNMSMGAKTGHDTGEQDTLCKFGHLKVTRAHYPAARCVDHAWIAVEHKNERHQKPSASLPLRTQSSKEGLLE